jgi:hypothetical protein
VYKLYGVTPFELNQLKPIIIAASIFILYSLIEDRLANIYMMIKISVVMMIYIFGVVIIGLDENDKNLLRIFYIKYIER